MFLLGKLSKLVRYAGNYFRQTTVHGLRYIVEGASLFERLLWLSCVVSVMAIASFLITNSLRDMRRNPMVTSTETVHISEVPKPAVSVNLPTGKHNAVSRKTLVILVVIS